MDKGYRATRNVVFLTRLRQFSSSSQKPNESQASASLKPNESQVLALPDSRNLGFATYGDPTGQPLYIFHGLPGCRLDARGWDEVGRKLKACVVGIDRPGMGLSTLQPGRVLRDWPKDVRALAKHLGHTSIKILGGSGGGPYALACARELSRDELGGTGVLYGLGPREAGLKGMSLRNYLAWLILPSVPWLGRFLTDRMIGNAARNPDPKALEDVVKKYLKNLSKVEAEPFFKGDTFQTVVTGMRQTFVQGTEGYLQDSLILAKPWGFKLEEIDANPIIMWYGDQDVHAPLQMGKYMSERIKNCTLRVYEGNSHFKLKDSNLEELTKQLLDL